MTNVQKVRTENRNATLEIQGQNGKNQYTMGTENVKRKLRRQDKQEGDRQIKQRC